MIRPRFSVRMLAIVVTLVCAYFGAWEATKRYGLSSRITVVGWSRDANDKPYVIVERSPLPFVMSCDELATGITQSDRSLFGPRHYYFWLFGPKIKLPLESTWKWDFPDSAAFP